MAGPGADKQIRESMMAWDFETEPEFQRELDWMDAFVREEVEPLDLVLAEPYDKTDEQAMKLVKPLQERIKERGLWACHLGPELGGLGYGQLKLGLMNEILGRSRWAPSVFGCQAPDSGNAEILAHYGSDAQKEKYLQPLLDGDISSCYSMTEPHADGSRRQSLRGNEYVDRSRRHARCKHRAQRGDRVGTGVRGGPRLHSIRGRPGVERPHARRARRAEFITPCEPSGRSSSAST